MPSLKPDDEDKLPSYAVAEAMLTHNSGRGSMIRVKAAFDRRIVEEKRRAAAIKNSSTASAPVNVKQASYPPQNLTHISVVKPSKDTKLGLTIKQTDVAVFVSSIHPNSLFVGTSLMEGMVLQSINGRCCQVAERSRMHNQHCCIFLIFSIDAHNYL